MPLFEPAKAKKQLPPSDKWSVTVERNFCKACRFCIDVCPVDVFQWSKEVNAIGWFPIEVAHEANCVGCMLCYQVCPDFVINVEPKKANAPAGRHEIKAEGAA
ncbi:MAG TPA: ferredoxin family protein [bacterium]|nr:ferredoxin family protein [bacterium]